LGSEDLALSLASDDLLSETVAIFAAEEIDRGEAIAALVKDPILALRLLAWIPEAFGYVLISRGGKVTLPATFTAWSTRGKPYDFRFEAEPIFAGAVRLATKMINSGQQDVCAKVALGSSMVATVNTFSEQGSRLEDIVLTGPGLVSIPAEVYLSKQPLWRRIFRR
jgi:hypothetical protein